MLLLAHLVMLWQIPVALAAHLVIPWQIPVALAAHHPVKRVKPTEHMCPKDVFLQSDNRLAFYWHRRRCAPDLDRLGFFSVSQWIDWCKKTVVPPGQVDEVPFYGFCPTQTFCKNVAKDRDGDENVACLPWPKGYRPGEPLWILDDGSDATAADVRKYMKEVSQTGETSLGRKFQRGFQRLIGGRKHDVEVVVEQDLGDVEVTGVLSKVVDGRYRFVDPQVDWYCDVDLSGGAPVEVCNSHLHMRSPSCDARGIVPAKKGTSFNFHIDLSALSSALSLVFVFFMMTPARPGVSPIN